MAACPNLGLGFNCVLRLLSEIRSAADFAVIFSRKQNADENCREPAHRKVLWR